MKIETSSGQSEHVTKRIFQRLGLVFLCGALSFVAGCNTIEGVGEDVQSAGKAVERAAK